MTEIYRKDRPTDIVMYRGNYSQLKNIFLLQTQPISSRESSCQISVQSVGQEMAEILRIQRTCGWWWVGGSKDTDDVGDVGLKHFHF